MRIDQLVAIVSLACVASSMPLPKTPGQHGHGPFLPSGNVANKTCKPSTPHRRNWLFSNLPPRIGIPLLPNPISSDSQVKDFFHDLEARQDRLGPLVKQALGTMNATDLLFLTQQVQEKARLSNIRVEDNDGDCGDVMPPPPLLPGLGNGTVTSQALTQPTGLPSIANTLPISSSNVTSAESLAGHKAGGVEREPPRD